MKETFLKGSSFTLLLQALVFLPVFSLAAATSLPEPVEGELAAGEVRRHSFSVPPGQAIRIVVEQLGIDLVVEVHASGGDLLARVDTPLERFGSESLVLLYPPEGPFKVQLKSAWTGVGDGRYRLHLERLEEEGRRRAEEAWSRGASSFASSGAGAAEREAEGARGAEETSPSGPDFLELALASFAEAEERFRQGELAHREAMAIHAQGRIHRHLGSSGEARDHYLRALDAWKALPFSMGVARVNNDLGLAAWDLGELAEADAALQAALVSLEGLGERVMEVEVQQNRCLIIHARGQLAEAVECYEEGRDRLRHLGELRFEGVAHNNLGFAYFGLGEPTPSIASYQRALEIRREVGDRAGEAQALNNLAVVYRGIGEMQEALALYDGAKILQEDLGDRRQLAATLSNLGAAYRNLGQPERARAYFAEALALRRSLQDVRGEVSTLGHLGQLRCLEREFPAGLALLQRALVLARTLDEGRGVGAGLVRLARCRLESGAAEAARQDFEEALRLLGPTGDLKRRGEALHGLGRALVELGLAVEAISPLEQSYQLRQQAGNQLSASSTQVILARAFRDQGEAVKAKQGAAAALDRFEAIRGRLASPELRASFFSTQRQAFEVLVSSLVDLQDQQALVGAGWLAFQASEQARARSLLDLLEDNDAALPQTVDSALLDERSELRRRLYLKAERQRRAPRPGPGSVGKEAFEVEIVELQRRLDVVEGRLREIDPRYATLMAPARVSRSEVEDFVGEDSVLLEYFLAEPQSFLWKIDQQGMELYEVPGRAEIEKLAGQVYAGWSSPAGDQRLPAWTAELSSMLLGPVAEALSSDSLRRVVIAADGALHLLPFAALPLPTLSVATKVSETAPLDGAGRVPEVLLDRFDVVGIPSVSAILARRRLAPQTEASGRRTLVVADPVFDGSDSRLVARAAPGAGPGSAPEAARFRSPEAERFPRLGYSRDEAESIARLGESQVELLLGFDARVEALLHGDLSPYRFLHVASHGWVDTTRPALGGLLLSRHDERGRSRDGWLRLADIYDLRLKTELVVLSGCRTAVGRQLRGEGLLGLSRGFLHAGSKSVAASLWALQDRAAAELMASLYRHLWQEGLSPSAALRQAQLELRHQRRWSSPFYWAPWVLQGDWE